MASTINICLGEQAAVQASVSNASTPYTWTWSNSSSADSAIFDSDAGSGYVNLTDGNGCVADTASFTIVEDIPPVVGTLSASQVNCGGTLPDPLTLAGHNAVAYSWIISTDTITYTTIAGATNDNLSSAEIGAITQTSLYKAVASNNNACPSDTSNVIVISTIPETQALGDTTICLGESAGLFGSVIPPLVTESNLQSDNGTSVADDANVVRTLTSSATTGIISDIDVTITAASSFDQWNAAYEVQYFDGSVWQTVTPFALGVPFNVYQFNGNNAVGQQVQVRVVDIDNNQDFITYDVDAAFIYVRTAAIQFEWSPAATLNTINIYSDSNTNGYNSIHTHGIFTIYEWRYFLYSDGCGYCKCKYTAYSGYWIYGADTICSGTSTTLTAIGGSEGSGASYEWYASGPGVGPILSTTSSVTVSPSASIDYYVRRVPTSTGCSTPTAYFSVSVEVNPTPTAPSAGGTIITAGTTASLSASGAGPNDTYHWFDALTGGTELTTGATYTTPVLNATTTYYVELLDITGGCPSARTPVTVTVNPAPSFIWTGLTSSDWNVITNWVSGVVPGLTDVATIPATGVTNYPMITGTANVGPTVIESGASMNIAPGGVLNVLDVFANNGTLTLMSDATGDGVLMDTAAGAQFSGSITVERYNPGDQFHILGTPVVANLTQIGDDVSGPLGNGLVGTDGVAVSPDLTTQIYLNSGVCDSLNVGSNYGNVFSYDESLANNCSFEGWVVESAGVMEPGKGYMTFLVPGSTVDFTGTPNTGSITTPSMTNSGGGIFSGAGWNLLSNPYPSYVNTADFIVANPGINSPNTFTDTGVYTGSYQSILPVTGQNVIAIAQGFVMRNGANAAASPIAPTFTNDMRSTTGTGFRSNLLGLQVDVLSENGRDKTEVFFAEGATEGFDVMGDGVKHQSQTGRPTISTRFEDSYLGVQTYPLTDDLSRVIELDVSPGLATNFSFVVDADRIPLAYDVFLIDRANQTRQNIRTMASLEIANDEEVISSGRFAIEISKANATTSIDDMFANVMIWDVDGTIIIDPSNASFANNYRVEVFDMLGRLIMSAPNADGVTEINLTPHRGYVNIRLSGEGSVMTTKLFVK